MKAKVFNHHFFLFVFIVFLNGFFIGHAQVFNNNAIRTISEMMDKNLQSDLFSGVVLLAEHGKIVFDKAYGYADRGNKKALQLTTEFRLASSTKLFTLVSIMQLYDDGKLSLDDKLGKYLEGFSDDISKKVTLRQLLTMSAGFGDYRQDPEYAKNPLSYMAVNDYLKVIKKEKLLFEPGSQFQYSNSGFVILGAIIEKVSGKNYYEYVKEKIFLTAGMTHTYFPEPAPAGNQALPYIRSMSGEYVRVNELFPASPSSNAVSTASDMLKFLLKACTTTDLMSDKSKILFFSQYAQNYSGNWDTLKSTTRKDFGWIGGLPGESTLVMYKIVNNLAFIILSNFSDVSPEVFDGIISILRTGKYKELQVPLTELVYTAYKDNGAEYVKGHFTEWTKDLTNGKPGHPPQSILNTLGYELIEEKNLTDAIALFNLNIDLFPGDADAYDSLAEGYMLSGEKEMAIKFYEKSLELNPENSNAVDKLKELKSRK